MAGALPGRCTSGTAWSTSAGGMSAARITHLFQHASICIRGLDLPSGEGVALSTEAVFLHEPARARKRTAGAPALSAERAVPDHPLLQGAALTCRALRRLAAAAARLDAGAQASLHRQEGLPRRPSLEPSAVCSAAAALPAHDGWALAVRAPPTRVSSRGPAVCCRCCCSVPGPAIVLWLSA